MLLNRLRAMEWMQRCEVDVMIASSPVNVQYLTDFQLWVTNVFRRYMVSPGDSDARLPLYAVLTSQGETSLVVHQECELNAADLWVKQRYVYGADAEEDATMDTWSPIQVAESSEAFQRSWNRYNTANEALANVLRDNDLGSARIGIEASGMTGEDLEAIKDALPNAQIRDSSTLFRLIRMVKSAEEQKRLKAAASIAETAALESLKLAQPHRSFQEIIQSYREQLARDGADLDHFAFSAQGTGMATEIDYRLSEREVSLIDFGCVYKNYYSDAGLTLVLGEPDQRTRDIYRTLNECVTSAAELLRPGTLAADVQAHMANVFASAEIKNEFPHGHGLGLDVRDYPILVPDNGRRIKDECVDLPANLPLEEGMLLNLEAPVLGIGNRAFQLEQTYLVTPTGGEPITNRDLANPFVVG